MSNMLTLSLLRGPLYPAPGADEGAHHFTYSLYPHPDDWAAGVVDEAFALNSPLIPVPVAGNGATPAAGFLTVEGLPLALGSLKRAEEDNRIILRLHEPHGRRGRATLRFAFSLAEIERVNLLEEPAEGTAPVLDEDGMSVQLEVRPFEEVTLQLNVVM